MAVAYECGRIVEPSTAPHTLQKAKSVQVAEISLCPFRSHCVSSGSLQDERLPTASERSKIIAIILGNRLCFIVFSLVFIMICLYFITDFL